jgi:uncharacterized protein
MHGWTQAAARVAAVVVVALTLLGGCRRMYTPERPLHHATDLSGVLTEDEVAALNVQLDAYEAKSKHCVVVFVLPSSQGEIHGDFAHRVHNTWKIGREKYDDGVILFVFTDDRVIRISVGFGLETVLPDKEASRIAHDVVRPLMLPHPAEALKNGVEAITSSIDSHEGKPKK